MYIWKHSYSISVLLLQLKWQTCLSDFGECLPRWNQEDSTSTRHAQDGPGNWVTSSLIQVMTLKNQQWGIVGVPHHFKGHPFLTPPYKSNPTLGEFCYTMIGKADTEELKSNIAEHCISASVWRKTFRYPCLLPPHLARVQCQLVKRNPITVITKL